MFIGRQQEMLFFNERYYSNKAEFITLYGRRRVGKTEFLSEFCKDKPTLFYTCREYTDAKQFSEFSDAIFSFDYSLKKVKRVFADWNDAFSSLADVTTDRKLVVIIDEFPYMAKGNNSIPSVLQALWDHKFKDSNIMLILSGSSVSFMEDEVLAAKNPLYGRMTAIYKMEPLPFADAVKFFPDYSYEEKIEAYSILGGVPHYLKQFDAGSSLAENVKKQILTKGTVLFGEVDYILHQELREPAAYVTILEAVAFGYSKFSEISEKTQIESSKLSIYLKNLTELGLITKELPAMSSKKDSSKKGQGEYIVADNFFRFWFAYAYPYMSALNLGQAETIWSEIIEKDLHHISAKPFEKLCTAYLWKLSAKGKTPFKIIEADRWWGKVTHKTEKGTVTVSEEIDILATGVANDSYILGECKFTNEAFDIQKYKLLKSKDIVSGNTYFYLFSLSGFTDALKELAKKDDSIRLIDIDELFT